MKIKIYTIGGTIDKVYFDQKGEYQVGEPEVLEILDQGNVTFSFECQLLLAKDSLDMTDQDRALIVNKVRSDPLERIVITHGTDTMAATAKALKSVQNKTVVLTGAMQPARFKDSDAAFNVGCAVAAVQVLPPGIYIAMNGQIFNPDRVRKNRDLNRFEEI